MKRSDRVWDGCLFPATSVAQYWILVTPSVSTFMRAELPATVCVGLDCAPLSEYSICFTIPPGLSLALSVI
jgi:hypothetical protein